nr:hypothetical protein [Fluviispira vulneris]
MLRNYKIAYKRFKVKDHELPSGEEIDDFQLFLKVFMIPCGCISIAMLEKEELPLF